jgi:hypothetical protein
MGERSIWQGLRSSVIERYNDLVVRLWYRRSGQFRVLCAQPDAGLLISYMAYAGLGNRLRAHNLAARVGELTGRRVASVWMANSHLMSNASDVLELRDVNFNSGSPAKGQSPRYALIDASDVKSGRFYEIADKNRDRLVVMTSAAQWVSFQRGVELTRRARPAHIPIRSTISAGAAAMVASIPRPYLAVHIRQTDFITHTGQAQDMDYFERLIRSAATHRSFKTLLIASDDALSVTAPTRSLFEQVIILRPSFSRGEEGAAPEAMEHLLVLMDADEFIPSPHSSFSELVLAQRRGLLDCK